MSEEKSVILKIGGSVITDKNAELVPKTEAINRIAEEIHKANLKNLVIVHGGGSFGHPIAKQYGLKEGLREENQKIGFTEAHHAMTMLNGLVMDALILHNIRAVSLAPSSFMRTEDGRIRQFDYTIVKTLLKMGFTPVLYGDVILDAKLGFTIISGDQITAHLAGELGATRIVIGVDTHGLYDSDPKVSKTAKLYEHLTLEELKRTKDKLGRATSTDVTGGMFGKIVELIPAIEQNIPVTIVNAAKSNRTYRALVGDKVEGTEIKKD